MDIELYGYILAIYVDIFFVSKYASILNIFNGRLSST